MGRHVWVNTCSLESFEGLHQAIQGSHVEVMQLGRGKFRGSFSRDVGIGDFLAQRRLVFGWACGRSASRPTTSS